MDERRNVHLAFAYPRTTNISTRRRALRFRSATYITSFFPSFFLLITSYIYIRIGPTSAFFFFEERPILPSLLTKIHVLLLF